MSKTDLILATVEQLRSEFKAFNDVILPAIQQTINDQLKPVLDKQTELEKRLSDLEQIVHKHIKHA